MEYVVLLLEEMTRCPKSIGDIVFHPIFWGHLGFQNGRHVPPNFIIIQAVNII